MVNAPGLCVAALGALLIVAAGPAVARGQNASVPAPLASGDRADLPAADSVSLVGPPEGAEGFDAGFGQPRLFPRWTASAEYITLDRIGGVSQDLVSTYPPHNPLVLGTGTERLNSTDLNNQGFSSGPKVGLIRHGDSGYDMEFLFFEINGWSTSGAVNPQGNLPDWLVFAAPGDFVQTTDYPYQSMAWAYATKLRNAEWNVRWDLCPRVTMLAGFRWVNLWENLDGTIVPSDRASPFWKTTTHNNLYGVQLGEDWKLLSRGPFSISGLVRAGLFDNVARESTGVSIYRTVYWESAATNHVAFLGECGLQAAYQANEHLLLRAGYEAIWLQGLALAPAQIPDTLSHGTPPTDVYVQALGIHCNSGVLFHGLTLGVEYSF